VRWCGSGWVGGCARTWLCIHACMCGPVWSCACACQQPLPASKSRSVLAASTSSTHHSASALAYCVYLDRRKSASTNTCMDTCACQPMYLTTILPLAQLTQLTPHPCCTRATARRHQRPHSSHTYPCCTHATAGCHQGPQGADQEHRHHQHRSLRAGARVGRHRQAAWQHRLPGQAAAAAGGVGGPVLCLLQRAGGRPRARGRGCVSACVRACVRANHLQPGVERLRSRVLPTPFRASHVLWGCVTCSQPSPWCPLHSCIYPYPHGSLCATMQWK